MSDRIGSCLCGAVQYHVYGEPLIARICWCSTCQKISANGTVNAIFPSAAIDVTGTMSSFSSEADSGNVIARYFCPTCGCHLFANSSANTEFRVVRVGTLRDPSSVKPDLNMWTSSAPAWACMDPEIKVESHQPAAMQPKQAPPSAASYLDPTVSKGPK